MCGNVMQPYFTENTCIGCSAEYKYPECLLGWYCYDHTPEEYDRSKLKCRDTGNMVGNTVYREECRNLEEDTWTEMCEFREGLMGGGFDEFKMWFWDHSDWMLD